MFSAVIQDHFYNPRNCEELTTASHQGIFGCPGDGPYMILWFEVDGDIIHKGSYKTYGCPAAVASASLLVEIAIGRSVSKMLLIEQEDLLRLLGEMPPNKTECARMAVDALHSAFEKRN